MYYEEHYGTGADDSRRLSTETTIITAPTLEPVSLDEVRLALKMRSDMGNDTDMEDLIAAVRRRVEIETGLALMKQTLRQVQDVVGNPYTLTWRPVLSISSIKYIASFDDDTELTVTSTSYVRSGNRIAARTSWPAHRGFGSWLTTFVAGHADHVDSPSAEQQAAARAAVPEPLRRAIIQWVGHLYENAEGQFETKYQMNLQDLGNVPPNVRVLLDPYMDRRLSI